MQILMLLLKPLKFGLEDEMLRVMTGHDKVDVTIPDHVRQSAGDTHHRRDPHATSYQHNAVCLFACEYEFATRGLHFDCVANF